MKSRFTQKEKAGIISQYQNGSSAAAVCEEHGIASSTLYSWIREQKPTGGSGGAWGKKSGEMLKKRYADLKRHADKIDSRNPYPAEAYMVVADDNVREWGTQDWEKKSSEYSAKGYVPISMKDDFAQIYADDITRAEEQYHAYAPEEEQYQNAA